MTLEEAIQHCYEKADEQCGECRKEHLQLALWLEELESLRKDGEKNAVD